MQVLTDRLVVIEPHSEINGHPIADGDRIADERGRRVEQAAGFGWIARDRLRRLSVAVDVSHAGWNDRWAFVLPAFELTSHLPLMIGAPEPWPVMADGGLGRCANESQAAERLRSAARDTRHAIGTAHSRSIACARVIVSGVHKASDAHIPH